MKYLSLLIMISIISSWPYWQKSDLSTGTLSARKPALLLSEQDDADSLTFVQSQEPKEGLNNHSEKNEPHLEINSKEDFNIVAQIESRIDQYDSAIAQESEGLKFQYFLELKSMCEKSPLQRCGDFFLRELENSTNPVHIQSFSLSAYLAIANLEKEEKMTFLENFRHQKVGELMKEDIDKTMAYLRSQH